MTASDSTTRADFVWNGFKISPFLFPFFLIYAVFRNTYTHLPACSCVVSLDAMDDHTRQVYCWIGKNMWSSWTSLQSIIGALNVLYLMFLNMWLCSFLEMHGFFFLQNFNSVPSKTEVLFLNCVLQNKSFIYYYYYFFKSSISG